MPYEPGAITTVIAVAGATVAAGGWGVSLFNAWKAVRWKRAELASTYLRDLTANPVLVFACRALEWNGGRLVVPEALRPLLPGKAECIDHDPAMIRRAMAPDLTLSDMAAEPRLQLYRTAMDDLLSWLELIASGLERNLFKATDLPKLAYWVHQIRAVRYLDGFIDDFGYARSMSSLERTFARCRGEHRDGRASTAAREPIGSTDGGEGGRRGG